jgi:hypothetical protein
MARNSARRSRAVLFHRLEAERLRSSRTRDVLVRVAAQVHAGLLSASNRSIVDIGEIDHCCTR